jgi:hypothetical protein
MQDREIRAVDVIMTVDQQQFHKMGTGFTGLSGLEEQRARTLRPIL